jgi:hypothetical protein
MKNSLLGISPAPGKYPEDYFSNYNQLLNLMKFNMDKKTYEAKYKEHIPRNQEFSPKT